MLWKYLLHLVREAQESSIPLNPFSILFQIDSVISPGKNSWHGDLKTQIKTQVLYLGLDTEDKSSKTPGMNPIRMLTNSLL